MENLTNAAIEEIRDEARGTRSYFFRIPAGMTWEAGSDMHFAHPDFMVSGDPDKALIRHMSLITLPEEGKIGITTRVPGSGSVYKNRLALLKPGDEMVMFKLGNRFPLRREGRPVVLISMGVGAAALRPMIMSWLKDPMEIPSITNLVVDRKDKFVFRREFESKDGSGLKNIFSENRESFNNDFKTLPFDEKPICYIVGSDAFLDDVIGKLKDKGVRPEDIELDKKPDKKAEMLQSRKV